MRREVPFFDYSRMYGYDADLLAPVIEKVLHRGAFILQAELATFERNLAEFVGVRHVIGVANGTDALIIALRAAGIGPDHEVIVPSHTYVASVASIHLVGAVPILVECGRDHLIDPVAVRKAVTARTKAIMPVHLNGRTADMDLILEVAEEFGLKVVEDAAQAVGSRFRGRSGGTFGVAGTFSFYPAKTLGCFGDGGAVLTNDDDVAREVRQLRDHGRDEDGLVISWGFNSRLDNLQAAILDAKLLRLQQVLDRRRAIARQYCDRLAGIDDLLLPPAPDADPDHYDAFQNFEVESGTRDELRRSLADAGVSTIIQWGGKPVHHLEGLRLSASLPFTDRLFERCLLLPMNPYLTDEDIDYICVKIHHHYGIDD